MTDLRPPAPTSQAPPPLSAARTGYGAPDARLTPRDGRLDARLTPRDGMLDARLTPRAWHAGWSLAVLGLAALALLFAGAPPSDAVLGGLALLAAPGALALLSRPERAGAAGVVAWTLLAGLGVAVSGGVTGPLAAGALAPALAGVVLGRPLLGLGGACLVAGLVSVWQALAAVTAPAPPPPADGAALASGLLAVTAVGAAATARLRASLAAGLASRLAAEAAARDVPVTVSALAARLSEAEVARDRAEGEARARARFIAEMSHELRTPLNAVVGFSDIMRQRLFGPLSDRYGEYAELIHQSGEHLTALINDVLDISKIDAERYELRPERFDAREPVAAALRLLRQGADAKGVRLLGQLPSQPLVADADPRALKQMALNLLSNAVKFTPEGGEVTLTLIGVGHDLELTVADTGVGVSPEDLRELGKPYAQGQAGRGVQGTGLGLSLVKGLAGLHGGFLMLESRLGEGTAATVRLPVLEEAPPPPPASAPSAEEGAPHREVADLDEDGGGPLASGA